MSFRPLIDGECGGNNSLVQLSSILSRDGVNHNHNPQMGMANPADQFISEYLAQNQQEPRTFEMTSLLHGLADIQSQGPGTSSSQYAQREQRTNDMFNNKMNLNSFRTPSAPYSPWMPQTALPAFLPHNLAMQQTPMNQNTSLVPLQYIEDDQYLNISRTDEGMVVDSSQSEIKNKAKELVDAVVDQNVAYSQFIDFMKEVSTGGVNLETGQESRTYSDQQEQIDKLTEKYRDEWAKLSNVEEHPWLSQLDQKVNPYQEYTFSQENDMMENLNALDIGKQKLNLGDFPGAVLCFEAAVKQNPKSAEGWLLLGTTQAENEQDPQAIAALNQCIALDPTCLTAYLALGASYTNENYTFLAYQSFNNWLKANPKYSDLVPLDIDISNMNNMSLQNHLQSIFLRAAQMNPSHIDPDIQCALGVLFNLSREYNKAVDCFKTALMVKSDDSRLWNRLGATLANGERSEEAVDAYYKALQLEPGFIRARYNVGITCMNLGAHKEAAEHFLVALNQQFKAQGISPSINKEDTTSSTIWSTLRMVCAFMGKHELTALIDNKDLTQLNKHFGIE